MRQVDDGDYMFSFDVEEHNMEITMLELITRFMDDVNFSAVFCVSDEDFAKIERKESHMQIYLQTGSTVSKFWDESFKALKLKQVVKHMVNNELTATVKVEPDPTVAKRQNNPWLKKIADICTWGILKTWK
jgi:hypothetical protein